VAPQNNVITRGPDVLGGAPVFRGTRVPFQALVDHLKDGQTPDEFLEDFPTVTREAAVQFIDHAKRLVLEDARLVEAVDLGLKAAERGEFVEHEEVAEKLKRILRS
jgi:uncharacterized protein (DUF433 family)